MKKVWIVMMALLAATFAAQAQDDVNRIGAGLNYWKALDDIDVDNIDEDGISYLLTYQFRPSVVGFQLDLEMMPDRFGEDAYAPALHVIFGKALYAAAGIGWVNQDGDWADDPFFSLKAGFDLNILANIYLDLALSYRVDSETDLGDAVDNIDSDTIFIGAAVRLGF